MTQSTATPPARQAVFRQEAVQRAFSPDQLDLVLTATDRRGWMVLVALGLLLLAAVGWGVGGRITNKVSGRGILVRSGGVLEVVSPAGGRVTDIAVQPGDSVTEGQVVARLVQPELLDALHAARLRLEAARERASVGDRVVRERLALERVATERERTRIAERLASAGERVTLLRERVVAQQRLVERGLVTQASLLTTRQQLDQAQSEARQASTEMAQLEARELEVRSRAATEARDARVTLAEATAELARIERELAEKSRVVSPYTGRILEITTEQGRVVSAGEPVLSLDLTGGAVQELVAVAFVSAEHGKTIRPGMRIHVAPRTVRQEEHGMMLGTVTYVSDYPATERGMMRVLKNPQLVADLAGEGAPYEVHASLIPDPATVSRYRWSSSAGPDLRIESGTLAEALITVREQRPAELVVPALRRWVGL